MLRRLGDLTRPGRHATHRTYSAAGSSPPVRSKGELLSPAARALGLRLAMAVVVVLAAVSALAAVSPAASSVTSGVQLEGEAHDWTSATAAHELAKTVWV